MFTMPHSTVLARVPAAAARVSLRAGGGEGSGLRLPGHLMVPITRRPRRVMSGGQARRNNTHLVSDNVVRGPPLRPGESREWCGECQLLLLGRRCIFTSNVWKLSRRRGGHCRDEDDKK